MKPKQPGASIFISFSGKNGNIFVLPYLQKIIIIFGQIIKVTYNGLRANV